MFGNGNYFAHLSSKADCYAKLDAQGTRRILLCRVCLGEVHNTRYAMHGARQPPTRSGSAFGAAKDAVRALTVHDTPPGVVDYPEFVTFADSQSRVEFVIEYNHKQGCKCTWCAQP